MCKHNENIQRMANPNDRTELLLLTLSNQINDVRTTLTSYIDSKIDHLGNNVKVTQTFISTQFEDIKEQIKEVKDTRKDDRKELNEKLDEQSKRFEEIEHDTSCPNRVDVDVKELSEKFDKFTEEFSKDFQWISTLRRNKVLLILVLLGIITVFTLIFELNVLQTKNVKNAIEIIK